MANSPAPGPLDARALLHRHSAPGRSPRQAHLILAGAPYQERCGSGRAGRCPPGDVPGSSFRVRPAGLVQRSAVSAARPRDQAGP